MQASVSSAAGARRGRKALHPAIRWLFFWLPRRPKVSTSAAREPRLGTGPSMSDWTQGMAGPQDGGSR